MYTEIPRENYVSKGEKLSNTLVIIYTYML